MEMIWVVSEPREALDQGRIPETFEMAWAASFSALLSAALAENVLVPISIQNLALAFTSYLAGYALLVFVVQQIGRMIAGQTPATPEWYRAGAIVILPAHLLLPAALICRPLGIPGLLIYELFKVAVLAWMVRRGTWAVQALLRWPSWAAMLLALSPLILGILAVFLLTSLVVLAAGLSFLVLLS